VLVMAIEQQLPPPPPRRARNPAALSHKCGNKCGHALWPRDPYIDC